MRETRNKLLVTLILVAVASVTLSTASTALVKAVGIADPPSIKSGGVDADLSGEPDTGGNTVPPQMPRVNGASRIRGDVPGSVRDVRFWLTGMGRIWAVRLRGTIH